MVYNNKDQMSAQMKYCQNIMFAATIYLRNTNDILMNIKISDLQLHSESFKMNSSDNTAQRSRVLQYKRTKKWMPLKRIAQRTASQSMRASHHDPAMSVDKVLALLTCKVLHFNGQSPIMQKHKRINGNKTISFKCYFISSHSICA